MAGTKCPSEPYRWRKLRPQPQIPAGAVPLHLSGGGRTARVRSLAVWSLCLRPMSAGPGSAPRIERAGACRCRGREFEPEGAHCASVYYLDGNPGQIGGARTVGWRKVVPLVEPHSVLLFQETQNKTLSFAM